MQNTERVPGLQFIVLVYYQYQLVVNVVICAKAVVHMRLLSVYQTQLQTLGELPS
jgi:hypothetical protein